MTVKAEFDFREFNQELAEFINDNCEVIAKKVAKDARASINVVTGNLKKGIRAKESKFEDGGWIVMATAPHAHLVEYGGKNVRRPINAKVMKSADGKFYGQEVAPMPAKPFLRPALEKNIQEAKRIFGAR